MDGDLWDFSILVPSAKSMTLANKSLWRQGFCDVAELENLKVHPDEK